MKKFLTLQEDLFIVKSHLTMARVKFNKTCLTNSLSVAGTVASKVKVKISAVSGSPVHVLICSGGQLFSYNHHVNLNCTI